jgi:hypothetical protein
MSYRPDYYRNMFFLHRWSHYLRNDGEFIYMGKGSYLITQCRWCKKTPIEELEWKPPSQEETEQNMLVQRLLARPIE